MNFEDKRKELMDRIDCIMPQGELKYFDLWLEEVEDLLLKHENYEENLNNIINNCMEEM